MNEDADQRTEDILRSLLEDDDDDAGLGKELTGFPEEDLDKQLAKLLPQAISAKEAYLNRACKRTTQHTNPQGETFVFGKFGPVVATLLYLNPHEGWQIVESLDDEEDDFKDLRPEGDKHLRLGTILRATGIAEDVLSASLDLLETVNPSLAQAWRNTWEEGQSDVEYLAFEALPNVLQRFCPPYTYFGSYPADGDIGVWANDELIKEDIDQDPEKLAPMRQGEPMPRGSKYVVVLNRDDYPVTLLDGESGAEIWHVNY